MGVMFPRLKSAFGSDRKSDTRYGGVVVLKCMWDYLNCDCLLLSAGIRKMSGISANRLAIKGRNDQ